MAELGKYDLEKLKDCKTIYLRNPPKFIHILVFLVIGIIVGAAIYQSFTVKTEEIQSQGVVVDVNPHKISTEVTGILESIYVSEGDSVNAGDVLFTMDSSSLENERRNYVISLDNNTVRMALTEKFIDSLEQGTSNPFVNEGTQQQYYQKWLSYENELSQIQKSKDESESLRLSYLKNLTAEKESMEKEIREGNHYLEKIAINEQRISNYEKFIDALQNDKDNPFEASESEFYSTYEVYKGVYDSYESAAECASLKLNWLSTMYGSLNTAKNENLSYLPYVDAATIASDNLPYVLTMINSLQRQSTTNPFVLLPDNELEMKYYNTFNSYLEEIKKLDLEDLRESTYLRYQTEMQSERTSLNDQITSLKQSISNCDESISKYTISAVSSGSVHLDMQLNLGMSVPANTAIGTINSGSGMQIEMYIAAHDRAKMSTGLDCKFTIDGLMQSDFGCIAGRITSIQDDATVTEAGSVFKVIASFDQIYIDGKDGERIAIIDGMTVKLWVTYERLTYMDYFLEGLGI